MNDLLHIAPSKIKRNPNNPRVHFSETEKQRLIESIDLEGILVPLAVYKDEADAATPYVIIDGERRWRASIEMGMQAVPVLVVTKPNETENLLRMFHIHMVREDWTDMAIAWAIEELMEKTGQKSLRELSKLTGVSTERLERMLFALTLSKELQERINLGEIPMNFFYEAQQNLLGPLEKNAPTVFEKYGKEGLINILVEKRDEGSVRDVVELRKLRPIVNSVKRESTEGRTHEAKNSLEQFLDQKDRTIQDTFEDTVGLVVEVGKFKTQCEQLVKRARNLLADAVDANDRNEVVDAVETLRQSLYQLISE